MKDGHGRLIVIDGTDGSGKKTQAEILVDRLKKEGFDVEIADFPRYGERSAALVEDYLDGKFGSAKDVGPYRASIFYACDRYAASFKMREALQQGKIVVCNRYASSNMGHQAGKIKDIIEREKFLTWLDDLEFNIFSIPKPDLNILLYVPPEKGQELASKKWNSAYVRGDSKDIHEQDLDHLKEAAESYMYVAKKFGWTIIDCMQGTQLLAIDSVSELIWEKVAPLLRQP